jgi:hypothetical protein
MYPAPVLVIVPINNIVTTFDAPVTPIDLKYLFWIGLLWCPTGDAIGNVFGVLAAFLSVNSRSIINACAT